MSEEEMFNRIFSYHSSMKGRQIYAQLECFECLKLTNKMLEDETKVVIQSKIKQQKQYQAILGSIYSKAIRLDSNLRPKTNHPSG